MGGLSLFIYPTLIFYNVGMNLSSIEELNEWVMKAGAAALPYFKPRKTIDISIKKDGSPLTQADLKSHEILLSGLSELGGRIPVISEEGVIPTWEERKNWSQFWLLDPLDGTKEFLAGIPEFTVNLALIEDRSPVLGIVYAPALKKLYYAEKGRGAWVFDQKTGKKFPLKAIPRKKNRRAVESRFHKKPLPLDLKIQEEISDVIEVGSSLKLTYLAEGKADVYIRLSPIMEWDVAAGDCIYRFSGAGEENPSHLEYNTVDLKFNELKFGLLK